MNIKKVNILWLTILFVALFLGSIALYSEMKNKQDYSNWINTSNTNDQLESDVVLTVPVPNTLINSPVTISGKAKGNWFFEASLPIEIINSNGEIIGQGSAQAQGDWMTTEYVNFTATISFTKPVTQKGFIIIKKDNPSGLSEHDASVAVPIFFQ
jgi:hypothetical protein